MTRTEALEYVGRKTGSYHGYADYAQCELQLIWETSATPIDEIMAIPPGYSRGEAQKLWNARKNG